MGQKYAFLEFLVNFVINSTGSNERFFLSKPHIWKNSDSQVIG